MTNKKKIENIILKKIYQPNIKDYDLTSIKRLLEEYKSLDNYNKQFYYKNLCKLYILEKNYKSAIVMANKLIDEKGFISANYLLFKINIRMSNFKIAEDYLIKYQELQSKQKYLVDLQVYYYLLNIINKKPIKKLDYTDNINGIIINDEFKNLWSKFLDELNSKDFITARKTLDQCQNYVESKKLYLDFYELNIILSKVISFNKETDIKTLISNYEAMYNYGNYEEAKRLEDEIDKYDLPENLKLEYNWYKGRRKEKEILKDIINDPEKSHDFNYYKLWGQLYLSYKDFYNAHQYFKAGYYKTNYPTFLFYMGYSMYLYNDFEKAIYYFEKYCETYGSKMHSVYKILSESPIFDEKSKKEYRKLYRENARIYTKNKNKTIYEGKNRQESLETYNFFSENKYNGNLNDILKQYDESDYNEKLNIIEYLYKTGSKNQADNLLSELEKTNGKEKKLIQIKKNRELFIAKSKY